MITEQVEAKFDFFEGRPDLVAVRDQIAAGIDQVRGERLF